MAKRLVALFDTDLDYVNRFMAYVKEKRNLPFKMAGFSEFEALMEFLGRNQVDILIFSENAEHNKAYAFSEKPDGTDNFSKESGLKEEIWKTPKTAETESENNCRYEVGDKDCLSVLKTIRSIGKIVVLGDTGKGGQNKNFINKYQSAEKIISEILVKLEVDTTEELSFLSSDVEIIGVFSPACSMQKQNFSLCLANTVSKTKSVLYINLERFSGLKTLLGSSKDISMSDLIYFYKTNKAKIREGLSSSICTAGNFSCLTAPLDLEDLDVIGDENWHDFLNTLAKEGGYECIVVDMDEAIKKICSFFEICKAVYVPVVKGLLPERKIEEFKNYLKLCEKERLIEKLIEINVGEADFSSNVLEKSPENYLQYCFLGKLQAVADSAYMQMEG